MIIKQLLPALALAAILCASAPARAEKCTYVGGNGATQDCVSNNMPVGSPNHATAQASVSTTAAQVIAARLNRGSLTIENLSTTPVYLGASGVTTSTGFLLPGTVGAMVTIPTQGAVYGVVGTGTGSIAILETF